MQRTLVKLVIAVALSLGCFGLTNWIYQATAPRVRNVVGRDPIAFVSKLENDVQRRPLKRTIWQDLQNGEPVYPGEAIRTSEQSEASLRFTGNGQVLDVEADSLIVLSSNKNEISLELLDGSVFVDHADAEKETSDQKLTLKSEAGAIDLSKATASLSKAQGKSVDLQVLKGAALLASGRTIEQGQSGQLTQNGAQVRHFDIKILSPPTDGSPLFVAGSAPSTQRFSWNSLPQNHKIELWLGSSRKNLKRMATSAPNGSSLEIPVGPGRHYWKLALLSPQDQTLSESSIYRLETLPLATPPTIRPKQEEFLTLLNPSAPVTFEWSVPENVRDITLEIASDPLFKKVLVTENFPATQTRVDRILKDGSYFWRLSAYYPKHHKMVAGPALPFTVWIKPPKNIQIAWKTQPILYFPLEPQANLQWSSTPDPDIKKWRVKVGPTEKSLTAKESPDRVEMEVTNPEVLLPLPQGGRWIASVEALDEHGGVLSKSSLHDFELNTLPLIPAPVLLPEAGEFNASKRGELNLRWNPVKGALSYTIRFTDGKGRELAQRKLSKTSILMRNLLPGSYLVEIYAEDEYGRGSEKLAPRRVHVPEKSDLSAPKFKKVEVK